MHAIGWAGNAERCDNLAASVTNRGGHRSCICRNFTERNGVTLRLYARQLLRELAPLRDSVGSIAGQLAGEDSLADFFRCVSEEHFTRRAGMERAANIGVHAYGLRGLPTC